MRKPSTRILLPLAAIWALLLPAAAGAEYLVPPGNSAATQYTETVPTAGGQRNAEKDRPKRNASPSEVLGESKASRLDQQGDAGREVAEFTAETAPAAAAVKGAPATSDDGDNRKKPKTNEPKDDDPAAVGAAAGSGGPGQGSAPASDSSGSSGLGEVLAQATGWSSSESLLLLVVLGTIAWAFAFLRRQRNRSTA